MADFDGQLIKGKVFQGTFTNTFDGFFQRRGVTLGVYQRIFNLTSGLFHYYTEDAVNLNPLAASVIPVAPDQNWDTGRHAVVEPSI